MLHAYKQVDVIKMEGTTKDCIRRHRDMYELITFKVWKRECIRYLSREDSRIYRAGLEATRNERRTAFCETAFEEVYNDIQDILWYRLAIVAHYDDGRIFDEIYFNEEKVDNIKKVPWLQAILNQIQLQCYPPRDESRKYYQVFSDDDINLFHNESLRKSKNKSRVIIDWFWRKRRK